MLSAASMLRFTLTLVVATLASADLNYTAYSSPGGAAGDCSSEGVTVTLVDDANCILIPAEFSALGNELTGYYFGTTPDPSNSGSNLVCLSETQDDCNSLLSSKSTTGSRAGICNAVISDESCQYSGDTKLTYKAVVTAGTATPCFPSSATVTMADGRTSRLDELEASAEIFVATAEGEVTTDQVSRFSVKKPEAQAPHMIEISISQSTMPLLLTPGHHLPVGASCCDTLKKAAEVKVGDQLWIAEGGTIIARPISKINKAPAPPGLHSPVLLNGGFPIVNGVVTSFDSLSKVTLASYGLATLEAVCEATGTCDYLHRFIEGSTE